MCRSRGAYYQFITYWMQIKRVCPCCSCYGEFYDMDGVKHFRAFTIDALRKLTIELCLRPSCVKGAVRKQFCSTFLAQYTRPKTKLVWHSAQPFVWDLLLQSVTQSRSEFSQRHLQHVITCVQRHTMIHLCRCLTARQCSCWMIYWHSTHTGYLWNSIRWASILSRTAFACLYHLHIHYYQRWLLAVLLVLQHVQASVLSRKCGR